MNNTYLIAVLLVVLVVFFCFIINFIGWIFVAKGLHLNLSLFDIFNLSVGYFLLCSVLGAVISSKF